MRRALRRELDPKLRKGKAVGPSSRALPSRPPTFDDLVVSGADPAQIAAHRNIVAAEIAAVTERIDEITARLSVTPSTVISEEKNAAERERALLRDLRRDLEADGKPITGRFDGGTIDDYMRKLCHARARELRMLANRRAEREAAIGRHREASLYRVASFASRFEAEAEMGWRRMIHYA